ncbi:MAG: hypothetical protein WBB28_01485 [Crinalium sp.]
MITSVRQREKLFENPGVDTRNNPNGEMALHWEEINQKNSPSRLMNEEIFLRDQARKIRGLLNNESENNQKIKQLLGSSAQKAILVGELLDEVYQVYRRRFIKWAEEEVGIPYATAYCRRRVYAVFGKHKKVVGNYISIAAMQALSAVQVEKKCPEAIEKAISYAQNKQFIDYADALALIEGSELVSDFIAPASPLCRSLSDAPKKLPSDEAVTSPNPEDTVRAEQPVSKKRRSQHRMSRDIAGLVNRLSAVIGEDAVRQKLLQWESEILIQQDFEGK